MNLALQIIMTKKITQLFLLLTIITQAQNIKISYTEIESIGAPGANLKAYNAALFINNKKSLYVTEIDSLENGGKRISKVYKKKDGSLHGIRSFSSPTGVYNILDRKTNMLHSNARFNWFFDYKEALPIINWEIKSKTKKIEGIPVQKAVGKFRGRNYVAWYATEIPIPLGPWKLNGLPGLIVEAYDTDKEILFLFKKLEYPYKKTINFPSLSAKEWKSETAFLKEKNESIKRNLKYSRAIGQQFDSSGSNDEEESLKKNFRERKFLNQ